MNIYTQAFFLCLVFFGGHSQASEKTDNDSQVSHYLQVGLSQHKQVFEFSSAQKNLTLLGRTLVYQYSLRDFAINLSAQKIKDTDQGQLYNLLFTSKTYSLGVDYNWDHFHQTANKTTGEYVYASSWLGLTYGHTNDNTAFIYNGPLNHVENKSELAYQDISLQYGFQYYFLNGPFTTSLTLSRQFIEEENTQHANRNSSFIIKESKSRLTESGVLANFSLMKSHYITLNTSLELVMSAGISRQITLQGEGRILNTSRNNTAFSNEESDSSILQSSSQGNSTSQQIHVVLLSENKHISFDINKRHHQSLPNAYFNLSFGIAF